jgi:uncharacterized protein (TIGR02246 family)
MRHVRIVTAALVLGAICAHGQTSKLDPATREGVERLLQRFDSTAISAGHTHDGARAALFSDDAVVINAFSTYVEGRAAVDSFWRALDRSTTFDSAKIERLDRQIRMIGPALVLVDHLERLTGQRTPKTQRELPPRVTRITLILRREADSQWRIIYYRAGDQRVRAEPGSPATPPS